MQLKISIIIPTHNASLTIEEVLQSVYRNEGIHKEVIIVDDASEDTTVKIAQKFPCRIIPLTEKSGPSYARNRGAREAKSDILMFMDSDALIEEDTLGKILKKFQEHHSPACISGVFEKNSEHSSLFAKYRDLQLHYWHQSSDGDASVFILTAGAIKKDVFFEVGGFKPAFGQLADIEDYEIGHRISEKYQMIVDKTIRFHHLENASPFPVLVKKLYRRARMWVPLFLNRKKFEKNYATKNRAFAVICAGMVPVITIASVFLPSLFFSSILCLLLFFIFDVGFYRFLSKQGSTGFLLFASSVHFFLSVVLFCGALTGGIDTLWKGLRGRS